MRARARILRLLLLTAALGLGAFLASPILASAWADTGDPLDYYGGPVVHAVTGVVVEWGPNVNSIYTNQTTGDPGLIKYFASQSGSPGDNGGVLAQYMDSTGQNAANDVSYGGEFQISPAVAGTTVQDSQVAGELVAQIAAGRIPAPTGNGLSTVYLVLFPAGTTICDDAGCSGQAFCSYHGSTQTSAGVSVLYDVLPDNTSGPMTQGCGTQSTLRNQTMYLSHEWAESIDDPLVDDANDYGPPLAWYDANCPTSSSMCGEVADKCNQETTTEGGWTVQLLWSNLDDACVGNEARYGTPTVSFDAPPGLAIGQPANWVVNATDPPGNSTTASWSGHTYAIPPGIASLTWNWGDGSPTSSGAQAVHTFAGPGIYTVTVTAVDDLGFTSYASEQVTLWGPLGPPVAQTGTATGVRETRAIVSGTIDAAGLPVDDRVDYGLADGDLGSSTTAVSGPGGTAAATVRTSLSNLVPGTTYFYRLDAVIDGQDLPGSVESFTTLALRRGHGTVARVAAAGSRKHRRRRGRGRGRAKPATRSKRTGGRERAAIQAVSPAGAIPVAATVVRGQTLAEELRRGVRVAFHCPRACRVSLAATLRLSGTLGVAAVPRVLASGEGLAPPSGNGTTRLRFSSSGRSWLSALRAAAFTVSGFRS